MWGDDGLSYIRRQGDAVGTKSEEGGNRGKLGLSRRRESERRACGEQTRAAMMGGAAVGEPGAKGGEVAVLH